MNTSRQTELAREGVTPQSLSSRFYGWLRVAVAALALIALTVPPVQAGVEFVTGIGTADDCNRVDKIGDGKDLFIIAGPDIRFRVFGNSVNLSNPTSGFRIATDSGVGTVTARIVSQGNDCGGTGFALVEVDSPVGLASDIQRSLFFKMPFGDESRLQMRIKAFPTINVTWTSVQTDIGCIVKTGGFEKLNQDHRIRITLPPGHRQDQTTCNQRTLVAKVVPSLIGELDIPGPKFKYSVSGLPTFMTSNQAASVALFIQPQINFPIDIAGIRALSTTRNSTITVSSRNPNRTSTLNLEVVPSPLANGFTQAANCRNLQTGDIVNLGDPVQCELRLAAPPAAGGQPINFEVSLAGCVTAQGTNPAGMSNFQYSSASGLGSATLTGAGTIFEVPLRTQAGTGCASDTGVQHTAKFWIGARDSESGADFTLDTFRIRSVP